MGGRRILGRRAFGAILAAAALAGAPAAADVRVYKSQHRVADDLLPLAETALSGRGSAAVDHGTNSLVLVGDAGAIADAIGVLEQQDRALRTVVLHYASKRRQDLEAEGVRVEWRVGGGSVRIGNVPGDETRVEITPEGRRTTRGADLAGLVRILEGGSGRISTGTTRPYVARSLEGPSTEFVTAETGFDARARILGDGRVQVALVPIESSFGRRGAIDFATAATIVELAPGETLAIASIGGSTEERRIDAASGARAERREDDLVLLLRAEIE